MMAMDIDIKIVHRAVDILDGKTPPYVPPVLNGGVVRTPVTTWESPTVEMQWAALGLYANFLSTVCFPFDSDDDR